MEFRDASFTPHLINLLVGASHIFPSALERLRPYFCSFDQEYGNLHDITASEIPERFPRETLNLNWFSGPRSRGNFNEVSEIIDRLIKADAEIKMDRRLQ